MPNIHDGKSSPAAIVGLLPIKYIFLFAFASIISACNYAYAVKEPDRDSRTAATQAAYTVSAQLTEAA
jgi:hypothetical protein